MGALPPIFIEFVGGTAGFTAATGVVKTELAELDGANSTIMGKFLSISKMAFLGASAAAIMYGAHAVHMAADFQTAMTRVQTGAGEAADQLHYVGNGVLKMAGEVGMSTEQLTASLYTVESAGYHSGDALKVLRVAAEGAKVGASELPPVADAVTTAMNAFKDSHLSATEAMNTLIATEANGKTNLEALAGSMSKILPVAASAHVGFQEVMAAMATMTSQGTTADVAATYLRQTIANLANPLGKASQEMRGLGLDSTKVSQDLGSHGLAYALNELTDAIQSKMGPAGTVVIETLRKASTNTSEYEKALANLKPEQQTYIGALANMVGGTKSMMGALQLTGSHMQTFQQNTAAIARQVAAGGDKVEGWAEVQKTFNQRMAEAKATAEAFGIKVGQVLMPYVSKAFDLFVQGSQWLMHHKQVLELVGGALLGILVAGLVAATIAMVDFTIAMLSNPVGAIIEGVMLLGAAIVWLAMNWRTVWSWIKSVGADVLGWIVGAWHWIASETMSAWHSVSAHVVSAWHSIAGFFVSAWHAVADPVVAGWRWVERQTMAVWHSITGFFAKWWPLLLLIFLPPIAILIGLWRRFHTQITDTAHSVWNSVAGFFGDIWDWICDKASAAWSLISDYIIKPTVAVGKWIASLWSGTSSWLGGVWDWICDKAASAWRLVVEYIITPIAELTIKVAQFFTEIGQEIVSAFSWIIGEAKTWAGKFADVGESIVTGIIHGLEGAWHWLTDKISHLASDALGVAKKVLDINSPSKVFADQVGRAIPEGIALGVDVHADKAHSAVRRLASAVSASFGLSALEPAFAGGPDALSSGRAVKHETHVHVTVQGTVTADRDLADTIKRVMLQDGARNRTTYQPFRR